MEQTKHIVKHAVDSSAFRKRFYNRIIAALFFVPASGIVIMTYLGVYPWPDLLYVLAEFSGPIIAVNVTLILLATRRGLDWVVKTAETGSEFDKQKLGRRIKRRLPVIFFGVTFLYTLQGTVSANISLESFQGYSLDLKYYLYTLFGAIPTLLVVSFPVYLSIIDLLGRYLAPRGVQVVVTPLSFRYIILGLFTPLLIDTVLLLYYYDRTKYFSVETLVLWVCLLVTAALGTLLAWRSMLQSISPISSFIDKLESGSKIPVKELIPQSLDEIGMLTGRYAEILRKAERIEGDLVHERSFVNAVLENANALVVVQDREGRICRFNRACEELTGLRFEDIQGGYIWDYLLDPREAEDVRANTFQALVENPRELSGRYTNYWVIRDRSKRRIDWSKSALLDEDGNTEFIVSIGIDVTEKYQAELGLMKNLEMQRLFIDISQQLESAKNHTQIIEAIGPSVKEALGYSGSWLYLLEDEPDSHYCRMIAHTPDRLTGKAEQPDIVRFDMTSSPILRELFQADRVVVVEDARTDPRTTKDRVNATNLRTVINAPLTVAGKWIGMLGIGTFGDEGPRPPSESVLSFLRSLGVHVATVCDRIEYERQLAATNDELENRVEARTRELREAQHELLRKERLATLGQLTATVSHELRNPLAAMRPSTYILRKKYTDDESAQRALERIERGINRCDHIIDELLDFTRITSLECSRQELDRWLAEMLQEQRLPGDLKVHLHRGLDGYYVEFDPHRLRRALINIIENAAQAFVSETDGKVADNANIELSTRVNDGRVELVLKDNGPGIPEDVLPRIFEPLYSTRNFGVGLGMPTVKQIMEQHDGGIDVQSKPGEGTTVILWLPTHSPGTDRLH